MASLSQNPVCSPSAASQFTATHWTMVLLAGGDPNVGLAGTSGSQRATQAAEALERLRRTDWFLLDEVRPRLGAGVVDAAKGYLFEQLKMLLTGEKKPAAYSELAATLQTTEAALKMSVSRLRQRYGELWRAEIANTVTSPAEVGE